MNKKLFALLIGSMSLSLLGIIFVQGYWINNAYQAKEDQFTLSVRQILIEVAKKVQLQETENYYKLYSGLVDSLKTPENVSVSELIYRIANENKNETVIFSDGIIEEDYKLSSFFLDTEFDTIQFKKITNQKKTTKIIGSPDGTGFTEETKIDFNRMRDFEKQQFQDAVSNITSKTPIHNRISSKDLEELITNEARERGIKSKFEYAVYSNELATKIRSNGFQLNPESTYGVPLFVNDTFNTNYQLYVNFSDKGKEVVSTILGMALLSLAFTGVIILAYSNALKQLFRQRQISQIKTDFINNMTHEFKTPIATINLALDALKNPKVAENKEFIDRYLKMIREENRRMHAQVENVLRISKLEKNELDLPKARIKLHDIIEDAVTHISLIVEDRGGYVNTHLEAMKSSVLGNDLHLTNVVVNILDNAIKYSEDEPKIDIYTENVKNSIMLKIQDQGMGMSKNVQKKIFEKFYREHTGDIHNVKGHGLGLAYVKRILDDHNAEIYVDSEKGKGSTFIIKMHLIS
ncbi:MAG: two-component sensor histidine kinase [Flavobacteriaceae bacterium]|nr:two-component sensor histidine kinase [Flavobacteriaceae bacterium]|tara:strand:+ start:759 stop:2321 length:1563 start_codon:yes stop_codon:yes gene_type:complete